MPAETLNAEEVIKSFSSKGFRYASGTPLRGYADVTHHSAGNRRFGDLSHSKAKDIRVSGCAEEV